MSTLPLADRVALVTGASRGIGAALALQLATMGAQCVLLARTQGGLEEVDDAIRGATGRGATLLPMDLQRQEKELDMLGPSIVERFGRLDILVHAAGVLNKLTPVAHIEPRDWNEVVAVNMTAAWRLIRTCDPPLRASDAGRAVFLTSFALDAHTAYWGMYGAAKAGMEHLALTWAAEVSKTPLRVNIADPGEVGTYLRAHAFPGQDKAKLRTPQDVAPGLAALCTPEETRHGARVAIEA
ncbi:SDR family NAD(P)-dependent oxidoreductase [Roseomonas sp. AR75]|uniref:SDR family NAD(P)-dependent oxidoreductase n=1 Tax=Roseomonas sp. AR75 TaxID=2562311 RepID=UPI0010C019BA|nr:SDR family NAD(P)-dependent oxidoreductase [Roseomonas sp. AR75]